MGGSLTTEFKRKMVAPNGTTIFLFVKMVHSKVVSTQSHSLRST
jgi:hypothetical protein